MSILTISLFVCGTALNVCQYTPPHQLECRTKNECQIGVNGYAVDWLTRHSDFYLGQPSDTPLVHPSVKVLSINTGVDE